MTHLRLLAQAALVATAAVLAACAAPSTPQRPDVSVPLAYKEAADGWRPAAPADTLDRGPWWTLFGDPDLDRLVAQVEVTNQNVAAAVAAYAQARALVREQRAARFPSLVANGSLRRAGGEGSTGARGTVAQLDVAASWAPDLWDRVGLAVRSARAGAQASAADLAAASLSAQGELATNYVSLRVADVQLGLLDLTVQAYARALAITQNRYAVGVAARTDVLQAQTQLANARADRSALQAQRAQLEHAIAVLVGRPPADFRLPPAAWRAQVPDIPIGVPSELLQRRPDIAAAEREVAQANAQLGIQRTAYYPSLTLGASVGVAGGVGGLVSASNTLWSLGVSAAQLLFDAGATAARIDEAAAARDAAVARYRQTVLAAFQSVEDQLALARSLEEQAALRREASQAADLAETQMLNRYQQGQVGYTEVVTAQAAALAARRALAQVAAARQAGAIALIQALGGGWQAEALEPSALAAPAAAAR